MSVSYNKCIDSKQLEEEAMGAHVMERFFMLFHRGTIKDHQACFLTDLVEDIKDLCEDIDVPESPISTTSTLKKKLITKFEDSIGFYRVRNKLVVHSSEVNPASYSEATIRDGGLREIELTKAFSRMMRQKISKRHSIKWPLSAEELFNLLETHRPLQCIHNAICWSINPRRDINSFGYASAANKAEAEKISAISKSWEKLITKERTPLGIALSLTVHRITGSKEATTLLNRCGVGIPYTDVRYLNNNWAKSVTMEHKKMLPPGFIRGRSVHVTFDNSDGKQQTLTGAHTTHHTTGTIFQTRHPGDQEVITVNIGSSSVNNEEEPDYGAFTISKNKRNLFPPSFPGFRDEYKDSFLLKDALACNIAWVLLSAIGDNCLKEYLPEVSKDVLGPVGS